ncbi:MAG TPA: hypothetical protein VIL27_06885 [Clostridia bacterium]
MEIIVTQGWLDIGLDNDRQEADGFALLRDKPVRQAKSAQAGGVGRMPL